MTEGQLLVSLWADRLTGIEGGILCLGAVAALKLFAQSTGNFQGLLGSSKSGFKGWDFTTSPCQGWTGITCNLEGRITKLCAVMAPQHAILSSMQSSKEVAVNHAFVEKNKKMHHHFWITLEQLC